MAEKKDIYYDGRIYQQVPDGMSRYNYGSVHVDGKHSFVNMQAIIEGKDYETGIKPYSSTTVAYDMTWMNKERICPSCKNNQTSPDHNCDICNGIGYYTPPDELDKEAKELVFSNDDLDRIGNVKLIKFLLGRIDALKPKNKSQEVAIEAIKSMITETDYFKNGKSLIHIENENAGSLEYALNKFHAINDTDLQPTEAQSLIDMFYEKMAFQSTELRRHEIAKQCAIIHVQGLIDENDSMFKMAELHMDAIAIIVLSERLSQLNNLKQKIEAL